GFLTATASEDWALVLDVCDHASATEANAKEAVRALRREFKYGEPAAQLAAARLWAIMLRNSTDTFINQSTAKKFLDTLEDLLTSPNTIPVVRERVMDVLAAAAYANNTHTRDVEKDAGFRGLWRRVRPRDKPEEGMPFDTEDAMFNPPALVGGRAPSLYDVNGNAPVGYDLNGNTPVGHRDRDGEGKHVHGDGKLSRTVRRGIITPEEDMRLLFEECKLAVGNATLLSQSLAMATPEEVNGSVIVEFHRKCIDSQELIFTQIPWASAGAERSRVMKDQEERERDREREREARKRKNSANTLNSIMNPSGNGSVPDLLATPLSTREEDLLAELLAANEQLLEALKLFDDLKRVALEREAEELSRKDVRMDPRQRQYLMEHPNHLSTDAPGGSTSRSRSASPSGARERAPLGHPLPSHPQLVGSGAELTYQAPPHPPPPALVPTLHSPQMQTQMQTLAPPPAAPHGPRLPGASLGLSRTPSPSPSPGGRASLDDDRGHDREHDPRDYFDHGDEYDEEERPVQPSAKALGKRKIMPDLYAGHPADPLASADNLDDRPSTGTHSDPDDDDDDKDTTHMSPARLWAHLHQPAQTFVYDAAAERTAERIREGHAAALVNGVH
ncbi:hypothetical protein B0H16DRAFT_1340175, partial [Mycena metata]